MLQINATWRVIFALSLLCIVDAEMLTGLKREREATGSISRLLECFRRNNITKTSSFHPNSLPPLHAASRLRAALSIAVA